jgi:hypothetical protein
VAHSRRSKIKIPAPADFESRTPTTPWFPLSSTQLLPDGPHRLDRTQPSSENVGRRVVAFMGAPHRVGHERD